MEVWKGKGDGMMKFSEMEKRAKGREVSILMEDSLASMKSAILRGWMRKVRKRKELKL